MFRSGGPPGRRGPAGPGCGILLEDYAGFTEAIASLGGDGGSITVPVGVEELASTVELHEGVLLRGEGMPAPRDYMLGNLDCAVIKPTGDVRRAVSADLTRGCGVENLIVDMSGVTASGSGSVTGVAQADPAVVTSASHGLNDGDIVHISGVSGMTEINGRFFVVANVSTDTFELRGVDATGFSAYSNGGAWALKPAGIVMEGAWHSELRNVHVVNLPSDDAIGVLWIGTTATCQWNLMDSVSVQREAGGTKRGHGFVVQGLPASVAPSRSNQCAATNLRAYRCGDGLLMDEAGAGWVLVNLTLEENARAGAKVTNNTTNGYPHFLGGEIRGSGGAGVNGLALVDNVSMTDNTGGDTANGALRTRLLSTGERQLEGALILPDLPTSDPVSTGALWSDAGTLKVSAG